MPQELALYEDLPAVENLRYWGKAYGLRGKALEDRVSDVLGHIGLSDRAKDMPKEFSGGMKRRLNFGCGIVHKPAVLLLDEPTRGIDVNAKNEIYKLITKLASEGLGIIMVSSELPEILAISDRIMVMSEGQQTAEYKANEASEEKIMQAAIPQTN